MAGSGPGQNQGKSFYKEEPINLFEIESMGDIQALLDSEDELKEESEEEIFEAGEDMETDVQPEQSHQSSPHPSEES